MLKIGLFTFGGGYAMLALLENEFVSKKQWIEKEEFTNMVAIAESTPGPIAINSSTYIGYKVAGFWGSLCATVAVCIPSFIIVYLISLFFDAFLSLTYVAYAFKGIQVCVIYMIISSGFKMLKTLKKKPLDIILLVATIVVMVAFSVFAVDFAAVFYILIGGAVGLFVYFIGAIRQRERGKKQ
ncbi:MAG: chromate transporter [Clostridia bacterium]|nr:chromate transporter [Clostridia bacterium]